MTRSYTTLVLGLVVVSIATGLFVVSGPAAAAGNSSNLSSLAPYYSNNSTVVDNSSWMAGHKKATLDTVINLITRIGPYLIGSGYSAQGGIGFAGNLIMGILVFGVFVGASMGTNIGSVGGSVLAIAFAAALMTVGLMPQWLFAVILIGLGTVAAIVLIRPFE